MKAVTKEIARIEPPQIKARFEQQQQIGLLDSVWCSSIVVIVLRNGKLIVEEEELEQPVDIVW